MYYDNDKLNEIYRDTWPNLGWAIKQNKKEKTVKEITKPNNDRPT